MWISELRFVYPEIALSVMACLTLIIDLFISERKKWVTYFLCQATLVATLFLIIRLIGQKSTTVFYNMFIMDSLGNALKFVICLFGFFVFLYSREYIFDRERYRSEYFILCLFSILGMMILISAHHFLSLYLGIELFALPLYALITIVKKDKVAPEAAMKYFVMGALASGMLLYGISLLYGITGSVEMSAIADSLALETGKAPMTLLFALVFILVGLGFKFGLVPFHMWLPDVYQGAPMSVTLFIGTLPKLAGFGFAMRILNDTFPSLSQHWQPILIIMAVLSLSIGNIAAIAQRNLKRMLAYSTIAHMGFLFLGVLAGPSSGFAAALDYVIIYALMSLGAFGLMTALSNQNFEAENIQDFRGLGKQKPWLAFLMTMLLLSLSGIPPFAGFYAKFFVLDALMNAGFTWLAVLAVLLTVVGAFYYLRVIRVMFFEEPLESLPYQEISKSGVAVLSISGLSILALGIFPTFLFTVCQAVFSFPQ